MRHDLSIGTDHPAMPGHFPGNPVVPGVLLLAGVLDALDAQSREGVAMPAGEGCRFVAVKFHSPARPGQRLQVSLDPRSARIVDFLVHEGERRIASGTLEVGTEPPAAGAAKPADAASASTRTIDPQEPPR
ncbi:MAG: 3-hydroxyacyl-ACP dehydratase [Lautropia sp.]